MKRILTATALIALAAMTAAPALAAATTMTAAAPAKVATAPAATTKAKAVTFKSIDANKDGEISLTELQKVWPQVTKAEFDKFSKKKAGMLDHAELAALVKAQQPAKTAAMAAKPAK
jgi:Ca2+-binding EF-hand superfamily protein